MSQESLITGIDDATKCPCIGSIFIAGVTADPKTINQWKELGVKDSKLIASKKRYKLAKIIKETATAYSIQQITPQMIDNKTINLNAWEMIVVLNTINDLQHQSVVKTVHIDNWEVTEQLFYKRLSEVINYKNKELPLTFDATTIPTLHFIPEHRADELHVIVGAASILAKTASDDQYAELKKIYGDFGSGSPADPKTRLFVWTHRKDPLPLIRTSWNTYKMLVNLESIEDDPIYAKVKNKPQLTN